MHTTGTGSGPVRHPLREFRDCARANGKKPFRKSLPLPPSKGEHFITVCPCTHDSDEPYSN